MRNELKYYLDHQAELFEGHIEEYVSIMGNKVLGYYETIQEGIGATAQYPGAKLFHRCRPVGYRDDLGVISIEPDERTISLSSNNQDALEQASYDLGGCISIVAKQVPISNELKYYFEHQAELVEGHIDEYVSIMGNKVLGYYKTQDEGLHATIQQYPHQKAYFVHRCSPVGDRDDLDWIRSEKLEVRRTSWIC